MGGGLLQLVAYGAQDAYITGNPQITFWKSLYKRHTNFAMESFRVNFSGTTQWGSKQTAIVGRHADLLYSTYLQVELPLKGKGVTTNYVWNNDQGVLGFNLLRYIELDIGGQIIDRLYSEWLYLWSVLTSNSTTLQKTKDLLSGPCSNFGASALTNGVGCGSNGRQIKPNILYVPLNFFYTRSPGAALPLIALQYHEVKINVIWSDPELVAGNFTTLSTLPQPTSSAIYVDYIYLDTEERRRMAQASHEYLIEQVQFNEDKSITSANNRIDLTFNHPVKELVWVVQPSYYRDCSLMAPLNGVANGKKYYQIPAITYAGSGSGGLVDVEVFSNLGTLFYDSIKVSKDSSGNVINGGSGYTTSSALGSRSILLIRGSQLGGVDGLNDLYFSLNVVSSSGSITISTVGAQTSLANSSIDYAASTGLHRLLPFTYDQDPVYEQWMQINGQDRMDRRYGDYFNKVQSFQHHVGSLSASASTKAVYSYSFALKPEEHQPSGTCNFSRIDTATIVMNLGDIGAKVGSDVDTETWDVRVYAINYNILRVMSGMAGLAYSN
jgi:hypothetical protein